jgi:hypothetical protein
MLSSVKGAGAAHAPLPQSRREGRHAPRRAVSPAERVRELVTAAGQPLEYRSLPNVGHAMHQLDPKLFAGTLVDWAKTLR